MSRSEREETPRKRKPRTKLVSLQSYDTLVADFVEASLRHVPSIRHFQPRGFDAYFDVAGWPALLTHGDRMGSGGGTGFAFSRLRGIGEPIASTHGSACGPVSVLRHYDDVSRLVTQGGKRDGACETVGSFLNVPYSADYVFLRKP